jgi:hypothetical protein
MIVRDAAGIHWVNTIGLKSIFWFTCIGFNSPLPQTYGEFYVYNKKRAAFVDQH